MGRIVSILISIMQILLPPIYFTPIFTKDVISSEQTLTPYRLTTKNNGASTTTTKSLWEPEWT